MKKWGWKVSWALKGSVTGFDVWSKIAEDKDLVAENRLEEVGMIIWSL